MLEIGFSSFYVLLLQCVHWKTIELTQMEGSYTGCKMLLVLMNSAETLLKFTSKERSCMTLCKEQLCILLMQTGKLELV